MRPPWTRSVLVVLAVVTLAGTACAKDDATVGQPTTTADDTTPPPDTTSAPETSDVGGTGVTVTATNFTFTPTDPTVKSGETITFRDANPSTPHSFTVDDTDVRAVANGGEAVDVVIDLDPGEYDFHCEFHSQMQGTLTVT